MTFSVIGFIHLLMNFQLWFRIPLVRFAIHALILLGLLVNVIYAFNNWKLKQDVNQELEIVSELQNQKNQESIQEDFYQSPEYRETYAKRNLLKKKRGEEVVNTSSIEEGEQDDLVYIPNEVLVPETNFEKWMEYLFGTE